MKLQRKKETEQNTGLHHGGFPTLGVPVWGPYNKGILLFGGLVLGVPYVHRFPNTPSGGSAQAWRARERTAAPEATRRRRSHLGLGFRV